MNEMSALQNPSSIPRQDSASLVAENQALRERIGDLEHQIRLLKLELFGRGREKVNANSKLLAYPETGPRQPYLPLFEAEWLVAGLFEPIYVRQLEEILAEGVIHCGDTPVTIQQAKSGGSATGYVWVYCDHRGRVIYTFTERRNRDGPLEVLRNYRGYLQVDAFSAYDILFALGDIIESACWARARRRFVQACDNNRLAEQMCALIGDLYAIEREAKDSGITGEALRELRQIRAKPILDTIFDWLCIQQTRVLDKSPLGKAIRYALNQWQALCRYIECGEIEIDNNRAERNLRAIAVGRKSWTFVGNETFGQKAAVMFSLVSTCRELGIEPRVYLWDVMQRISTETDVGKLTPTGWKMHFADEVTKNWEALVAKLASASVNAPTR